MKIKTLNEKETLISQIDKTLKVGDFEVLETYIDGNLISQTWSKENKPIHPNAYNSKRMHYDYYEDISFLNNPDLILNRDYEEIPEPKMVQDWGNFKGFEHILCVWIGMDGNVYQIDKPAPLKIWRKFNYIAGFTSKNFDLEKVKKNLSKLKIIRNLETIEIPYYNAEVRGEEGLEFEYKAESEKSFRRYLEGKYPGEYFGL